MHKTKILLLTAGYTLAFAYTGCKKADVPETDAALAVESTVQAGTPSGYARKETYFKLPEHKGGEVDLSAYAGKPVMLMFFTEACPYCRKAAPFIERMHKEFAPKGLTTIGICLEDASSAAAGFARDFRLTFPVAYKGHDTARRYRAQGVPFIYLLSKDHSIRNFWAGYDEQFDAPIRKGIEELLK
ncbi:MAG TPA: TlpA disulfide reductase family protein [Elusimicrobiales bacterium]|nr:TlpA disulfide reductase family protein [Elusimicrobiales bacterium]